MGISLGIIGSLWIPLNQSQADLEDTRQAVIDLQTEKTQLETLALQRQERINELVVQNTELQSQRAESEAEAQRILDLHDDAATLQAQIDSLREEIRRLEEQRRPLRLSMQSTSIRGFLCTGSMEPKLTCLDTVTWMTDFTPEDIVAGAIVSYESEGCLGLEYNNEYWVAHRVISINESGYETRYLVKGDANTSPDACTINIDEIKGYVIDVQKNTRLQNATLREEVNASREAFVTARDAYVSRGYHVESRYNKAVAAHEHYSCWYNNALNSRYPGHIPNQC